MVGIPVAVGGLILGAWQLIGAFSNPALWALWWRPVLLIFVGYLLQWIGHQLEGNHVGEFILIRKALGLPYIDISPRYARPSAETD